MTPLCKQELDIPQPLVDRLRSAERYCDPEYELTTNSRIMSLPRNDARGAGVSRPASPTYPLNRWPFIRDLLGVAAGGLAFIGFIAIWLFLILVMGRGAL